MACNRHIESIEQDNKWISNEIELQQMHDRVWCVCIGNTIKHNSYMFVC